LKEDREHPGSMPLAVGIILAMAFIGAGSALAWRLYADQPQPVASQKAVTTTSASANAQELKKAVRRLAESQQQLVTQVDALEATQKQSQQLWQSEINRLVEQLAALRSEVASVRNASKQAPQKQTPTSAAGGRPPSGGQPRGPHIDPSTRPAAEGQQH
jgi:septal ring factor EnvC (AmiA/AmiB activator)